MRAKSLQSCLTLCDPMNCSPPGSLSMGFSSKSPAVRCHAFLQGIFLTQGSNPRLLMSPALAGEFFTTSATGKCDNTYSMIAKSWDAGG